MKLDEVVVAGKATNIPFKQVAVQPDMARPEVWLECECLLRFWKRRAFHAFTLSEAPAGEVNYEIDLEHLAFSLAKIKHYQELLARRDQPQALEVNATVRRCERSEDSVDTERRGRG